MEPDCYMTNLKIYLSESRNLPKQQHFSDALKIQISLVGSFISLFLCCWVSVIARDAT